MPSRQPSWLGRRVTTRIGTFDAYVDPDGILRAISFAWSRKPAPGPAEHPALDRVAAQLGEYAARERKVFELPLLADGSEFQRRVWAAIAAIPYGEMRSYGDVAKAVGDPGAARAVGLAAGANPIPVVIPCHRVVGADGSLTGFGGGLAMKRALLDHERGAKLF